MSKRRKVIAARSAIVRCPVFSTMSLSAVTNFNLNDVLVRWERALITGARSAEICIALVHNVGVCDVAGL